MTMVHNTPMTVKQSSLLYCYKTAIAQNLSTGKNCNANRTKITNQDQTVNKSYKTKTR